MKSYIAILSIILTFTGCQASIQLAEVASPNKTTTSIGSTTTQSSTLTAAPPKPSLKPHLIGSGIILGVSLLTFIPAGIYFSRDGMPAGVLVPVGEAWVPGYINSQQVYIPLFSLASIGTAVGLTWLMITAVKARSK